MLSESDRQTLLGAARNSVQHGLSHGHALPVNEIEFSARLREPRASFVTLTIHEQLRGCIGSLEAQYALIVDVVQNAYAAAFRDPRFNALDAAEFALLDFHISILNPPEPVAFTSERNLIEKLRPGIDGLVLQAGARRGTFLPQVWQSLPEPSQFLQHLKQKAGLRRDYWSDDIRVQRYTVEEISAA